MTSGGSGGGVFLLFLGIVVSLDDDEDECVDLDLDDVEDECIELDLDDDLDLSGDFLSTCRSFFMEFSLVLWPCLLLWVTTFRIVLPRKRLFVRFKGHAGSGVFALISARALALTISL